VRLPFYFRFEAATAMPTPTKPHTALALRVLKNLTFHLLTSPAIVVDSVFESAITNSSAQIRSNNLLTKRHEIDLTVIFR